MYRKVSNENGKILRTQFVYFVLYSGLIMDVKFTLCLLLIFVAAYTKSKCGRNVLKTKKIKLAMNFLWYLAYAHLSNWRSTLQYTKSEPINSAEQMRETGD